MTENFTLSNGMRVHVIPSIGTQAATVLVLTKVGSRYEYPDINGASHYIEHLMFKGTKKRPTTLDISRTLDAVGAEFNAYTGKDLTGYYVKVDGSHLPLAVDLLHDMLFNSLYDQEEMDRERGVIIEEINMYQDNPMMHVEDLFEQVLFEGSTLGWEIAGSHKTMRGMTRDQVISFRDSHYIPSRMVIAVAGKVTPDVRNLLEETFGKVPSGKEEPKLFTPFAGVVEADRPRAAVQKKDTEQIQLAMGMPSFGVDDKRNASLSVLSTILGGTMSSRLFISVRERKGLAYFVRSSNSTYDETGAFLIRAGLDKSRLSQAVSTIREEIQKIKTDGVTEAELLDAKTNKRGRLMLRLEDSSDLAEWYAKQELFVNKVKTPEEKLAEIDAVTAESVLEVANEVLNEKRMSLAMVGPYESSEEAITAAGF